MLYLDTDADAATGWHGYDFLVNRTRDGHSCSVERYTPASRAWEKIAMVPVRWEDNRLDVSIPRETLGVASSAGKLKLDFKWVDNIPASGDILDFYGQGDVAPDARFNYRFAEP